MSDMNCGELIEKLSKFPKDKPIKILALGIENDLTEETIDSVDYPCTNYDEEIDEQGYPVFVEETEWVGIFTKEYTDNMLMNGI